MSIINSYFFDNVYKVRVMTKSELNKLCMDENDSMLHCNQKLTLKIQQRKSNFSWKSNF